MMTAEFMLSKRPVLRFTAALFFLLKLFSSHIYCIPKFNEFLHFYLTLIDSGMQFIFRYFNDIGLRP